MCVHICFLEQSSIYLIFLYLIFLIRNPVTCLNRQNIREDYEKEYNDPTNAAIVEESLYFESVRKRKRQYSLCWERREYEDPNFSKSESRSALSPPV